jgi:hypothetical protein
VRVPNLLSGGLLSIFRQHDTSDPASDQQDPSPQSKHHAISWLSTMRCPVDLTTKSNPCLLNKEYKQERERTQPNCRWMINLTKLGQTRWWRNCSRQNNLIKT